MIQITESAAEKIKVLLDQQGLSAEGGLRVLQVKDDPLAEGNNDLA